MTKQDEHLPTRSQTLIGNWVYMFPAAFLAHIAEEYFGGFPERMTAIAGIEITDSAFLIANGFFWIVMVGAIIWVQRRPRSEPLIVATAAAVIVNSFIHIGDALINARYSPGLVTALFLWLPLGAWTLMRAHETLPTAAFRVGVFLGLGAHVLVPLVGISTALLLGGNPVGS